MHYTAGPERAPAALDACCGGMEEGSCKEQVRQQVIDRGWR